jgi:glycosyltransferase involved in cell wall biosynthesis
MSQHAVCRIPDVSVVIPVRNEASTIETVIRSVQDQEFAGTLEVVVADGGSTDGTSEILLNLARRNSRLLIVQNKATTTPAGLNTAIRASSGQIIVRLDGHSVLPPGYVARAVRTLEDKQADNVGGIQRAVGRSFIERAIALAMTSRMGVGNARFHYGGRSGPTDTVYLGCFRRDVFDRFGFFDETLIRNQDYELNLRIRQGGGLVWFDPRLEVEYRPRSTIRDLWTQYSQYGRWKREVLRRYPKSVKVRQLAAPALLIGLAGSGVLALTPLRAISAIVPSLYGAALLAATLNAAVFRRSEAALLLPLVLPTMHVAWGLGFLWPSRIDH